MDVFFETAAKHFAKNPTSETADLILSLGGAIQTQLSKTKDAETQTSPQKKIAEEKDYENDKDTSVYLEIFGRVNRDGEWQEKYPPNPDWFGENKTYFFPWNVPKGYWNDRKYFNEHDPEDVGLVHKILKDRNEFYENASPNVYRCWRAATLLANEQGIGSLSELRKGGYTDEEISSLCDVKFLTYSDGKVMLLSGSDSDFFQLNGYFW